MNHAVNKNIHCNSFFLPVQNCSLKRDSFFNMPFISMSIKNLLSYESFLNDNSENLIEAMRAKCMDLHQVS
jgi:hypothetical protein